MTPRHMHTDVDRTESSEGSAATDGADEGPRGGEGIFRAMFEHAGVGLAHVSLSGRFLRVNKAYCDLVGYSKEELLELSSRDLTHPDDLEHGPDDPSPEWSEWIEPRAREKRLVRKDGEVTWVQEILSGIPDNAGEPQWFVSVVWNIAESRRAERERDEEGVPASLPGSGAGITERKMAERELTEGEGRFRSLMEQSPLAMEILDADGRIREVNAAWMRLWGLDREETDRVLARYNMRSDEQAGDIGLAELIERAFAGEHVVLPPVQYDANRTVAEFGLGGVEGLSSPWIQCHLYPVKDVNGDLEYLVNTYVDLTEVRRAEQEAREQREALARVARANRMGRLTGSIAHELNQPLTGILSNAQAADLMLQAGSGDLGDIADTIQSIIADAKRAGAVVWNLRELYREQKVEHQPTDLNTTVEETTRLFRSEFILRQITVTTDCAPSLPLVEGNRIQLQQVLVNLIMNGDEAMRGLGPSERRLHIGTTYDGDDARVWVDDFGPGIDPDKIDRIFEPLATWKPDGTGMGLAISDAIIRSHGGRMWAENRPEGGARVGFSIPVPKMSAE